MGPEYRALKRTMRSLDLVTVCEEAGCPNIYECWADGTATFMINGDRCTRACGFCLVDTRKPGPSTRTSPSGWPRRWRSWAWPTPWSPPWPATTWPTAGQPGSPATIDAIHRRCPGTAVEVLIPDCQGEPPALEVVFDARPEVLNHNLETVARLQRAVRPSASYARSLAVLARAKAAGLTTKSGLIVGMGETDRRGRRRPRRPPRRGLSTSSPSASTSGPTSHHLPVARWWTPEEFDRLKAIGEAMGIRPRRGVAADPRATTPARPPQRRGRPSS